MDVPGPQSHSLILGMDGGVVAGHALSDVLKTGIGLFFREPPAEERDYARSTVVGSRVGQMQLVRHPDVAAPQIVARRHDADHGVTFAIDLHRRTEHAGVPAKTTLPQLVAQHSDLGTPGDVFLGHKATPEKLTVTVHRNRVV